MIICTTDSYVKGIPVQVPKNISHDHVKIYRYAQEPYFQETWSEVCSLLSNLDIIKNCTYILIKPDAFPARKAKYIVEALEYHKFDIIDFYEIHLNRHMIRELWRYEFNTANVARYELLDLFLSSSSAFILILKDQLGLDDASERLTKAKGPSSSKHRPQHSIRNIINAADGTLNHIHTPDSTLDFIRELGVLLPSKIRREILSSAIPNNQKKRNCSELFEFEQSVAFSDLSYTSLLERNNGLEEEIIKNNDLIKNETFTTALSISGKFGLCMWDFVTICNEHLEFSVPGVKRVFDFETAYKRSERVIDATQG